MNMYELLGSHIATTFAADCVSPVDSFQIGFHPPDISTPVLETKLNSQNPPQVFSSVGKAGAESEGKGLIQWTGSLDSPTLIDGVRIGWSATPEDARVWLSDDGMTWKPATGWFSANAGEGTDQNERMGNDTISSENVIFQRPMRAKSIKIEMRDLRNNGWFGIKQLSVVGHMAKKFL